MMRFFLRARVLGACTLVATAGMACGHAEPDPGHSADTGGHESGGHESGSDGAMDDGADADDGMAYEPCTLGLLRCDGTCVDPETDLANCGACGATCEGTCERSRCTVQLASQAGQLLSLSLDDTHVYWRNLMTRSINRVAKQGGAVEELYLDPVETPGALFESDGFVYTSLGERIVRIPSTGGAPEDLAVGSGVLAVSAEDVYFNTSAVIDSDAFARVAKQGGTPVVVANNPGVVAAVVRGDTLTFLAADGLFSTPLKGTSPQPLATGIPGAAFALDDSYVYFAYGGGDGSPYVGRLPLAGGAEEVLANIYLVGSFAIDDTHLYGGGFAMVRIPLAGGTVEDLGRPGTSVLKVEPHEIYWLETTPGLSFVNVMAK